MRILCCCQISTFDRMSCVDGNSRIGVTGNIKPESMELARSHRWKIGRKLLGICSTKQAIAVAYSLLIDAPDQ